MAWAVVYQGRLSSVGIMMGGDGIMPPIAALPPKTTLNHKKLGKWGKWEKDTSKAIYSKAYTVFPYFRQMGKWGKYGENEWLITPATIPPMA